MPENHRSCLVCNIAPVRVGNVLSNAITIDCPRCGRYYLHLTLKSEIQRGAIQIDPLLSSWLRERHDAGEQSDLTTENVPQIQEALPRYSVPHKMNMVLQLIADRTKAPGQSAKVSPQTDGALVWVVNEEEFDFYLTALRDRKLISYGGKGPLISATITATGWDHFDKLGRSDSRGGRAFVAMWFSKELLDAREKCQGRAREKCARALLRQR